MPIELHTVRGICGDARTLDRVIEQFEGRGYYLHHDEGSRAYNVHGKGEMCVSVHYMGVDGSEIPPNATRQSQPVPVTVSIVGISTGCTELITQIIKEAKIYVLRPETDGRELLETEVVAEAEPPAGLRAKIVGIIQDSPPGLPPRGPGGYSH